MASVPACEHWCVNGAISCGLHEDGECTLICANIVLRVSSWACVNLFPCDAELLRLKQVGMRCWRAGWQQLLVVM